MPASASAGPFTRFPPPSQVFSSRVFAAASRRWRCRRQPRGFRTASPGPRPAARGAAMTPRFASALLPLMRALDAETAHGLALRALRAGLAGRDAVPDDPVLATTAFGLAFRNPIGLAAGFDK